MKHKLNPVMDAQLNRNRARQRGHRRNLSDGRISSATEHIGEDVSHVTKFQTSNPSIVVFADALLLSFDADWSLLEPARAALL
jgi:hypothetical protein